MDKNENIHIDILDEYKNIFWMDKNLGKSLKLILEKKLLDPKELKEMKILLKELDKLQVTLNILEKGKVIMNASFKAIQKQKKEFQKFILTNKKSPSLKIVAEDSLAYSISIAKKDQERRFFYACNNLATIFLIFDKTTKLIYKIRIRKEIWFKKLQDNSGKSINQELDVFCLVEDLRKLEVYWETFVNDYLRVFLSLLVSFCSCNNKEMIKEIIRVWPPAHPLDYFWKTRITRISNDLFKKEKMVFHSN